MKYDEYKDRIEKVFGYLVPGQEEYLFNKIKALPEESLILELGSCAGRSSIAMGFAARAKKSKIICVDHWQESDKEKMFQENINAYGLQETITAYKENTHCFLRKWNERFREKQIDFVFIDASHTYEDVLTDFILSYPIVKINGLIGFHDIIDTWPGCYYAWHNFAKKILSNQQNYHSLYVGTKKEKNLMYVY